MSGGKGRREGTRTASHNKHLRNKRKNNEGREQAREHTTSRQNKGRKSGGGESTQEPNPGTQKSKQRKAEQATKQNTTARQLKQDESRNNGESDKTGMCHGTAARWL